mgnify:FL=1
MEYDGRRIAVQEIPKEIINSMDYATRKRNFEQELQETLRTTGRLPLWKYDELIKALVKKWRV